MEKSIEYIFVGFDGKTITLLRRIEVTYIALGRYGTYLKTLHESQKLEIRVSHLEWMVRKALEGLRVHIRASEIAAIKHLLDLDYEFEEDPSFLLYMEENEWDV